MTFDDPAFQYIPWAEPLSDPRKAKITVKQLLNHTSGLVGEWWFEYFNGDQKHGKHPSHSLALSARDMARITYCMLRNGEWRSEQVIPEWFVDETAAPTHNIKGTKSFGREAQSFSHGWELPARLTDGRGEGIPIDARFKPGTGGQLIAFVPSLDLVLTRKKGSGWPELEYEKFLRLACEAVLD